MKIAYRRVSTTDQNMDRQLADRNDVERVFEEKISGASRERPALKEMMAFSREGDVVLVHSLDRLGRDIRDLLNIVEDLNAKGVVVEFVSESLQFSKENTDPLARLQLHMLGAFAQWERTIAKRRQAEGIARAKMKEPKKYRGRPARIVPEDLHALKAQGLGATEIARRLSISRASVYRILNNP